jgi:hypothetical protein
MIFNSYDFNFNLNSDNFQVSDDFYFQEIENKTYESGFMYISELIQQIQLANICNFGTQRLNDLITVIKTIMRKAHEYGIDYIPKLYKNDLWNITDVFSFDYIKAHENLMDPLLDYINHIKSYLMNLGKPHDIKIRLQGSHESDDFNLLVLDIKTDFIDLSEKMDLYDVLGDILDNVTADLANEFGESLYDDLAIVTYEIGEIDD